MKNILILMSLVIPFFVPIKDGTTINNKKSFTVNYSFESPSPAMFADSLVTLPAIKSFPDAWGFGNVATGGRGGVIIEVTNLNDSGSGSLRSAVERTGSRTVVFKVSGYIALSSPINIDYNEGDLTIAGQTSAGMGITLRNHGLRIQGSNVIIRYIRFRPGASSASGTDGVTVLSYSGRTTQNVILDHCSISWAKDENFNVGAIGGAGVNNVTLQNSIVAENIDTGYGVLLWSKATKISFYKNLLIHNSSRNIRSSTCTSSFEMINNVIHRFQAGVQPTYENDMDIVGNVFTDNGAFSSSQVMKLEASTNNCPSGNENLTRAYIENNTMNGSSASLEPQLNSHREGSSVMNGNLPIISNTGTAVRDAVLSGVGTSISRDAVDVRLVNDAINNTGSFPGSNPSYPSLTGGATYTDSDNDGMPNDFETLNGLDPNDASDRNDRPASMLFDYGAYNVTVNQSTNNLNYSTVGWTAIEFWLNYKGKDYEKQTKTVIGGGGTGAIPVITLTGSASVEYEANDTYTELGATATDAEDGDISGDIVITGTLNMGSPGTYYKYYNVTDSDGNNAVEKARTVVVTGSEVPVTGVTVEPTSGTITIEQTIQILRWYEPSNASVQVGVWSSSNETIATVDHGLVTPTGTNTGDVDISYTSNEGGYVATATITVTGDGTPGNPLLGGGLNKKKLIETGF